VEAHKRIFEHSVANAAEAIRLQENPLGVFAELRVFIERYPRVSYLAAFRTSRDAPAE
jgi:hypothetical protein